MEEEREREREVISDVTKFVTNYSPKTSIFWVSVELFLVRAIASTYKMQSIVIFKSCFFSRV